MKRIVQDKLAWLIVPAALLVTAPAFGQAAECATDADCAEGQTCQKGVTVDPCVAGPPSDGSGGMADASCTSEPHEAETGFCYTPPPSCESDADCGEYLSCLSSSSDCAVDSDGNMSCPDVDPVSYCAVGTIACASDDECPREFECIETMNCLLIDCAEDSPDCPDPCAPSGEKQCEPKRIECEEAADCPSEWTCVGNNVETCEGGGAASSPGDGGGSEGTPASDEAPADDTPVAPDEDVNCTRKPAVGVCQPNAWSGLHPINYGDPVPVDLGEDGAGAPETNTGDPTAPRDADDASAGGGCSVAKGHRSPDFAWVLALLAALPLVRRRSVA